MINLERTIPSVAMLLPAQCFAVASMQSAAMDMGGMVLIILGVGALVVGRLAKKFTHESPKTE